MKNQCDLNLTQQLNTRCIVCAKVGNMMPRNKKVAEKFGSFVFISYFCSDICKYHQFFWGY